LGFLTEDIEISSKNFMSIILLLSVTLAWFLILQNYISEIFFKATGEQFWVNLNTILFFGFGAIFALIGASLSERVTRRHLLIFWILVSSLTTLFLAFFEGIFISILLSVLLGFSLGFGFPSVQGLFKDDTTIKGRGRISGITFLVALIILFLFFLIIEFLNLDIFLTLISLTLLRILSLFGIILEEPKKQLSKQESWTSVLNKRGLIYYLLPWLIFNIATGIREWWDLPQDPLFQYYLTLGAIVFIVLAAVFCFVSGIISDYLGRKQPILYAIMLMGVSYATLGFDLSISLLFIYDIFSGIAWGLLLTAYLTLPGDLAKNSSAEKYYALVNIIPFVINGFLSMIPDIFSYKFASTYLAPFLSIIIFFSIIPILRGGETLPDEIASERKKKKYFEKVSKLVENSESEK
jgi:MFS family permease